tara:strand:+ start:315 stop:566 length:252 start_codon:yes stop_codon:yes gene_type:complete
MKNGLTLSQHQETAQELKEAIRLLRLVFIRGNAFPKSHKSNRILIKILHNDLPAIRTILDDEYHKIISDDEFKELGNIYYGID